MITIAVLCAGFAANANLESIEKPAAGSFYAPNEELRGYLIEAAELHPELLAKYAQWQSLLQRIPQVTSLEDPVLTYGQFVLSDVNRVKVSLAQKFPWFGTLRVRGDRALARANAALQEFYAIRNHAFASVKKAYFDYAFLAQSVRVTEAQLDILDFMEEIVRSKYTLGLATEDEVLRIQIEQAQVRDQRASLDQFRFAASARLSEAVGRTAFDVLPWPKETQHPPILPETTVLLGQVKRMNPELRAIEYLQEGAADSVALARKKGRPDFTFALDYTSVSRPRQIRPDRPRPSSLHGARRLLSGTSAGSSGALTDLYAVATSDEPLSYRSGGEDNLLLTVKVNLPIWRKRIRASVEEASLIEKSMAYQRAHRTISLQSAAQLAIFEVVDARRRFDLFTETLLPQAEQAYESLQSSYATADTRASFLDLLESVQLLLDFELQQVQASRDLHVAAANLEMILGGPWIMNGESEATQN